MVVFRRSAGYVLCVLLWVGSGRKGGKNGLILSVARGDDNDNGFGYGTCGAKCCSEAVFVIAFFFFPLCFWDYSVCERTRIWTEKKYTTLEQRLGGLLYLLRGNGLKQQAFSFFVCVTV